MAEKSPFAKVKDNWRVVLLAVAIVLSTVFLFAPGFGPSGQDGKMTNLKYGLELSGGTRVKAPLAAVHATGVEFGGDNTTTVERAVASHLENVGPGEVAARPSGTYMGGDARMETDTVEVTDANVTTAELGDALEAAGYDYNRLVDGATAVTRQTAVQVLRQKVNEAGLSGGSVRSVETFSGNQHYVVIEIPNENRSEVLDLVRSRGQVTVQARYQPENSSNYTRRVVLRQGDFAEIGQAVPAQQGSQPYVPVSIKPAEAEEFQQAMVQTDVAARNAEPCTYQSSPNASGPCLLVVQDGEVLNSFGMAPSLAQSMRQETWADNPEFVLETSTYEEAQELSINLRAGALPAKLDLTGEDGGSSMSISAAQSASFKTDSVIVGVLAILAVSGVVFLRYGRPEVALPMIVTAMSEVVILLGFAAFIQYPLDLSVIAGFIAAIGTGVDDLIIIADEVMSEGEVNSRRVFQSRFRKAFWVIGAAAATTIIALSPLAVLSLGELRGFAIFTILGVIAGVLVTRPAYGDILRSLLTSH